jgi:hypothetical protein
MHREKKDEEAGMECDMLAEGERSDDSKESNPLPLPPPLRFWACICKRKGAQESIPPGWKSIAGLLIKFTNSGSVFHDKSKLNVNVQRLYMYVHM